jgi:hypothetical protein
MGQKFLQITENVAFSQTEEDWHFEDPNVFNEWCGLPPSNFVKERVEF